MASTVGWLPAVTPFPPSAQILLSVLFIRFAIGRGTYFFMKSQIVLKVSRRVWECASREATTAAHSAVVAPGRFRRCEGRWQQERLIFSVAGARARASSWRP